MGVFVDEAYTTHALRTHGPPNGFRTLSQFLIPALQPNVNLIIQRLYYNDWLYYVANNAARKITYARWSRDSDVTGLGVECFAFFSQQTRISRDETINPLAASQSGRCASSARRITPSWYNNIIVIDTCAPSRRTVAELSNSEKRQCVVHIMIKYDV